MISPKTLAVDAARDVLDLASEGVHDGAVARLAWFLELPADPIGIYDRSAASREHGGDGGLPDPDASRQADEYHLYTMPSNRSVASCRLREQRGTVAVSDADQKTLERMLPYK